MKETMTFSLGGRQYTVQTVGVYLVGCILIALLAYGLGTDSGYQQGYSAAYLQCYDNLHPENTVRTSPWVLAALMLAGGAALGMAIHGMPFTSQSSTVVSINREGDKDFEVLKDEPADIFTEDVWSRPYDLSRPRKRYPGIFTRPVKVEDEGEIITPSPDELYKAGKEKRMKQERNGKKRGRPTSKSLDMDHQKPVEDIGEHDVESKEPPKADA